LACSGAIKPSNHRLCGSVVDVFMSLRPMGALSYIGNAPNFMIYAIAAERGIKMPSFFGYMVWSFVVLAQVFALITYLFVIAR
jgi:Na+/H+ antiporter NhaD/arsenite permease-like protein